MFNKNNKQKILSGKITGEGNTLGENDQVSKMIPTQNIIQVNKKKPWKNKE